MFSRIIGNSHIKEAIRRMIEKGRVSNSLLLAGEDGIGKKQFALEIAKSFLCLSPENHEGCDKCSACMRSGQFELPESKDKDDNEKIFFSGHPDLGLLRPAGKFITVNQIRELEREANFRPFEGKARFFIIDEADRMNLSSANALLKTLEEPSSTTFIFLITSRPISLLQTIRSRCQIIRFAPIKEKEIEEYLLSSQKASPDDAALLSNLANGSIGKAITLDIDKFKEQREKMLGLLEAIYQGRKSILLKTAEELGDSKFKDDFLTYLDILQILIHDAWAIRNGLQKIVNIDLRGRLQKIAGAGNSGHLAKCLGDIERLRGDMIVNLNKKIACDALFLEIADF